MRRRIYSELLPYDDVVAARTLGLLARYCLELVLAVRPWDLARLPDVARALRDAGVTFSLWPMLADDEGRWANAGNADAFRELLLRVCDAARPGDVLVDLEPPFAQAKALTHVKPRLAALAPHPALAPARAVLGRTVDDLAARGITTSLAVWPLVALDGASERGWQRLLGTPVDGLAASHVSIMLYTSLLEGWSRGALRRTDAAALLAAATRRALRRWGPRAGVSLGCVGVGAFGDEPTYRDARELADDVAIARAAGCDALSLFDLGGVLARPRPEPWLDAFVDGGDADHRAGNRVRLAQFAARIATRALALSRRA